MVLNGGFCRNGWKFFQFEIRLMLTGFTSPP
jgi:hypothetical protein